MSDATLPPEQWRPYFDKINVEFGYRPLGTYMGMDHTRLRRLMLGGGTSDAAVRAVAKALRITPEKVRELRGEQPVEVEPFILPDDAGRLTHDERKVVRSVVRALLDARDRHDHSDTNSDTPTAEATRTPSPAGKGKKTAQGNVTKFPTRGRDFTKDPMIDQQAAAYVGDEGEAERARREQDEAGEESQDNSE